MPITVSIVEDNEQLRGTLARMISRAEGFECLGQHPSAEAGLAAIPAEKPNVVLMDINLPGMNGVECVRKLKEMLPTIQVVMLTAYEDTENIFNSLAAGAAGYLLKRSKSAEILDAFAMCKTAVRRCPPTSPAKWCNLSKHARPLPQPNRRKNFPLANKKSWIC
jgi:DNA-binding NarL/FixJ family response regulator